MIERIKRAMRGAARYEDRNDPAKPNLPIGPITNWDVVARAAIAAMWDPKEEYCPCCGYDGLWPPKEDMK